MRFCLVRYRFGFDDGRGWGLFISRRNTCFILRRNTHKSLKAPGLSILRFSTKEGPPVFRRLYRREVTPPPACQVSQNKPSALRRKRFLGRRAPKRPEGFAPKRTEGGSEGFAPKRPKAGPSVAALLKGRRAARSPSSQEVGGPVPRRAPLPEVGGPVPRKAPLPRGRRAGRSLRPQEAEGGRSEGRAPKRSEGGRSPRSPEAGGRSVAALLKGQRAVAFQEAGGPPGGLCSQEVEGHSEGFAPQRPEGGRLPRSSKAGRRVLLPRGRRKHLKPFPSRNQVASDGASEEPQPEPVNLVPHTLRKVEQK